MARHCTVQRRDGQPSSKSLMRPGSLTMATLAACEASSQSARWLEETVRIAGCWDCFLVEVVGNVCEVC